MLEPGPSQVPTIAPSDDPSQEDEDGVEKAIGKFGKYQAFMAILVSIGRFPTEFQLANVVFILPSAQFTCLDPGVGNKTGYCPCKSPQYDTSQIMSSVTSEWNLICSRETLASVSQSMMQIGILPGSLTYGWISDRFGRKLSVFLALFFCSLTVVLSAVITELWMFMVFRFLIGTSVGGTMLCCYIYLVELSGRSFRAQVCLLNEIPFIVGYCILPLIAYYVRKWRALQLWTGAPWLFVILFYWILPESPRWLITMGRNEQAVKTLTKIAKFNGRPTENIPALVTEMGNEMLGVTRSERHRSSYVHLFRTKHIRRYTILNALVWLCTAHTFFGVNQYLGKLHGNLYLNIAISALSLAPVLIISVVALAYIKRRISISTSFLVAGCGMALFIFIPKSNNTLTLVVAILGLSGIFSAFVQIYLYSAEIFPTIVRNSALGFASVFARIGSTIAPFVVNIGIEWITIVIFSAMSFLAAAVVWFLPETKDIVLMNTVEQTENWNINQRNKHYLAFYFCKYLHNIT